MLYRIPQNFSASQTHAYRPDIDGLRAVAVLAVIVFHAFPDLLQGGFIGVDIFFVISGYLISGHIFADLKRGTFSIGGFYRRRILRIFPALATVLAACLLAGWVLLLRDEYVQLGKHAAAGAAFMSNIVLWLESGYFDRDAAFKPLLHLWSLGVEEQFYIIWPVVAMAIWRLRRSPMVAIATIAALSFLLNIHLVGIEPSFAFYSPLTRFWQLLLGAGLAWREHGYGRSTSGNDILSLLGIAMLAVALVVTQENDFPGWWALLPTLGAACLIAAGPRSLVNKALSARLMAGIGLISYPLYLWHWPLLSFPTIILQQQPSLGIRMAAVAAGFVLAWATYRFVEVPIRFGQRKLGNAMGLAGAMALLLCGGLAINQHAGFQSLRGKMIAGIVDLDAELAWPYALNETCLDRYPYRPDNIGFWFCVTNRDAPPDILLLGNSFANDVYPGLVEDADFSGLTVLNIGACIPIIDVDWSYPQMMANHPCSGPRKAKVEHVIDRVIDENSRSLKLVVLSATWPAFDESGRSKAGEFVATDGNGTPLEPPQTARDAFVKGLQARIAYLDERGIPTVLFLPRPELLRDIRSCFSRPFVRPDNDCAIDRTKAVAARKSFQDVATEIAQRHPGLLIFDPLDLFCTGGPCSFLLDGRPLLRDPSHLSVLGSSVLATKFGEWARTHLRLTATPHTM